MAKIDISEIAVEFNCAPSAEEGCLPSQMVILSNQVSKLTLSFSREVGSYVVDIHHGEEEPTKLFMAQGADEEEADKLFSSILKKL